MRYVRDRGYPTPRIIDVSGPDLTLERIDGPTMLDALRRRPWGFRAHARTLARLHRELQLRMDTIDATAVLAQEAELRTRDLAVFAHEEFALGVERMVETFRQSRDPLAQDYLDRQGGTDQFVQGMFNGMGEIYSTAVQHFGHLMTMDLYPAPEEQPRGLFGSFFQRDRD